MLMCLFLKEKFSPGLAFAFLISRKSLFAVLQCGLLSAASWLMLSVSLTLSFLQDVEN